MGEMEKNGGGWGKMGGKETGGKGGGDSQHSTQNAGCGGLWREVEENGRKMGEKWGGGWEENARKMERDTHFFTVPFSPFFRGLKTFPTVSHKNEHTALSDGEMGFFATHRHSPPWLRVQVFEIINTESVLRAVIWEGSMCGYAAQRVRIHISH